MGRITACFLASVLLLSLHAKSATRPGLAPESARTSVVILANGDGHPATIKLHAGILSALPKDVKAIILNPRFGNSPEFQKLKEKFKADIASTRLSILEVKDAVEWVRDFGPELVLDRSGQPALVRFSYVHGSLGTRAETVSLAAAEAARKALSPKRPLPVVHSKLVIEGGSYFLDEKGRLYVSSKVPEANPGWSRAKIEQELKGMLGAEEVNWLPPLPGESTGHLDIYAKYLGNDQVLLASSMIPERKEVLALAEKVFAKKGYRVLRSAFLEVPGMPDSLFLTYANSLIVNGTAFVPQYAVAKLKHSPDFPAMLEADKNALQVYRDAGFRRVVGIPTGELITLGGTIHCMTKQIAGF